MHEETKTQLEQPASSPAAFGFHILTLFPDYFVSPLQASIVGRAQKKGLISFGVHDIRDHAEGKHRVCDDTPYGGGAGMVMKAGPVVRAMEAVDVSCAAAGQTRPFRIALTPSGRTFDQALAAELVQRRNLILVCGRYEGFDERVMPYVDLEIGIGDYVLTGGEPAALVMIDTIIRLVPGVLGNALSAEEESFSAGLVEYPHYTRPAEFRGVAVPDVLKSGDHAKVADWRHGQALMRTRQRRPDLWQAVELSDKDKRLLAQAEADAAARQKADDVPDDTAG